MVERTIGMTVDEFVNLYDEKGPFELVDGEIISMSPPTYGHGFASRKLFIPLANFVEAHKLGEVVTEIPFVLSDESNWVKGSRVPDIMFVLAERIAAYKAQTPDWRKKPLVLVPDLVVEIVSPTDRYSEVQKKVARYLTDGVQMVWVVDPEQRTVVVYRAGSNQQTRVTENESLDGGEIIPGFTISVASIFED
jgi:Uma2 family endonuclease